MICPFCGVEFSSEEAKAVCERCPISGACGMVRCPNCDTEMIMESAETIEMSSSEQNEGNRGGINT